MWIETEHEFEFFNLGPGLVRRVYVTKTPEGTPKEEQCWALKADYLDSRSPGSGGIAYDLMEINPSDELARRRFEANCDLLRRALLRREVDEEMADRREIVGLSFREGVATVRLNLGSS